MQASFFYHQTCPVLFGEDTSAQAGARLKALGCKKLLLVCDGNVERFGLSAAVKAGILACGLELEVFDAVTPDPTDLLADQCADFARSVAADGVVGVGGGSVLDTAKAVSVLLANPGSVRHYMKPNMPPHPGVPLVLIPTTSGTGSEVTEVGVITHTDRRQKLGVEARASLAIVDPVLTYSVPPQITADTAMDAFSHAAECVTCTASNPHADLLALEAIKLIWKALPAALVDGRDAAARRDLALASNLAGMAFNETSLHIGHALAHSMGVRLHLSHGAGCALALPAALEFVAEAVPGQLRRVAEAMGLDADASRSDRALGELVGNHLREFMRAMGIRSLRERGAEEADLIPCAPGAMEDFLVGYCPRPVTLEDMENLYHRVWSY